MKKISALILIMAMCATSAACGGIENKKAEVEPTQEATAEPTVEPTEEPEVIIDLKKKAEITSDVTMKVNSVTKEKKLTSGSLYYKPRNDGNVFAIINVSLKNASDSSKSFDLGYFRLVDQDGEEYIPTLVSSSTDDYKFIVINNLMDAKYKETGCLVFEVPKDAKVKKFKLCYNSSGFQSDTYFSLN